MSGSELSSAALLMRGPIVFLATHGELRLAEGRLTFTKKDGIRLLDAAPADVRKITVHGPWNFWSPGQMVIARHQRKFRFTFVFWGPGRWYVLQTIPQDQQWPEALLRWHAGAGP